MLNYKNKYKRDYALTLIHNNLKENTLSRNKPNQEGERPPQWKYYISEKKRIEKDTRRWKDIVSS